jgi:hypothetical protein
MHRPTAIAAIDLHVRELAVDDRLRAEGVAGRFTYGMMYGMRRTTIYLPDELKLALERTAAAQGTSEAEVVRHALIAATAESSAPTLRIPLFDSGDATLAERVDDELAAGFGE